MPIRFECETCDARMKVPDGSNGLRVKCPRCGQVQSVPGGAASVGAAVAAAEEQPRRLSKRQRKAARRAMVQSAMAGAGVGADTDDADDSAVTPVITRSDPATSRKLAGGLERTNASARYPKFSKRSAEEARHAYHRQTAAGSTTPYGDDDDRPADRYHGVPTDRARVPRRPLARLFNDQGGVARAYALLLSLSWSLRIVAGLLIPGAVKATLVVFDASGSMVVASLTLIASLAVCAMLLTVGEIAAVVRDLARSQPAS